MSDEIENKSFQDDNSFKNKNKRRKRKRKPFLANAKGFGKKGNFGRGSHIEADQYTYFISILDSLKIPPDTADDRVAMANNVLEQSIDNEINFASNQIGSKTLEAIIGFSDPEYLETFFQIFGENFRPICSDPFASHVLQKLTEIAFLRAVGKDKIDEEQQEEGVIQVKRQKIVSLTDFDYNVSTEFSEKHRANCSAFVQRVSKFLLNNLEDFIWDSCGSHLIRLCVLSLAGVHVPKATQNRENKVESEQRKTFFTVPSEWVELMREFPSRLEMWPQFPELPYQEHSSVLIGLICVAYAHVDENALHRFAKLLLKKSFLDYNIPQNQQRAYVALKSEQSPDHENEKEDPEQEQVERDALPSVFKTDSSNRLLETILSVAGEKLLKKIYKSLFAGRIKILIKDRFTSFPVQRLLKSIRDKMIFEEIFEELVVQIEKFVKIGHAGIITDISGACLRLNTKQAACITALQTAFHCSSAFGTDRQKSLFNCLLQMKPYEELSESNPNQVNLNGSIIVQNILQFKKPIFLVNCILETRSSDLASVLQTPNGSYIADMFLKSQFIGEKSREKFVKLLEGYYIDLAVSKNGSRVLERLVEASADPQKLRIAKELSTKVNKLNATPFGKIIYNVLRLETFKLSPDQWKASWTAKPYKGKKLIDEVVKNNRATT